MGSINKNFSLLLILILAVSSLIMAKPAFAQSNDVNDTIISPSRSNIPTPAVPNFTIQVVDSNSFSVIITNQPFTPFNVTGGGPVQFLYSIRVGPLNATGNSSWTWLYDALGGYPTQSNTQTTTITINLTNGNDEYGEQNPINVDSQFLIEVEAIIGYYGRDVAISPLAPYVIYGEASGWSSSQTITMPVNTPLSSTPTPLSSASTPSPSSTPISTSKSVSIALNPSLELIVIMALVVIVFLLVIIIILTSKRKPLNSSQQTVSNGGM